MEGLAMRNLNSLLTAFALALFALVLALNVTGVT